MSNQYVDKLKLSCKNCGGAMEIDSDSNVARCPYCSDTVVLAENENVAIAKIELAQQEIEMNKLKFHFEKKQEERLYKTQKSFLTLLTLIFAVISASLAAIVFASSSIVSASIALTQAALFFCAWLVRMRFIKGSERKIHTLVTIIALLCIIPFLFFMGIQHRLYSEYVWPSSGLSELIPQPKSQFGELRGDSNTNFSMLIGKTTIEEFNAYVEECKIRGFIYEQLRYNNSFYARNEDGTYISLSYIEGGSGFHLDIRALPEMKEYFWNTRGIAGMLPKPKSNLGFIKSESETYFDILIGQVDRTAYHDYVFDCTNAGFDIDLTNYDDCFSALNSDGYQLTVQKEYGDIMNISVFLRD